MTTLPIMTDKTDWKGTRVIIRIDLNVPIKDGRVRDDYRIVRALPTLKFLREAGARTVIIAHIGKGKPEDTLRPVAEHMVDLFPVIFIPDLLGETAQNAVAGMRDGDVLLLENLRHSEGEENNDPEFAKALSVYGDIYINDGFAVSHRPHASVVGLPSLLPSYAGMLFAEEVANLSLALTPEHPFLFILGGAKISTKMPLLKKFIQLADNVFVGGANADDILVAEGFPVGKSLVDPDAAQGVERYIGDPRLLVPETVVVDPGMTTKNVRDVGPDEAIMDIGAPAIAALAPVISSARLIVWNGPLGFYEKGHTEGTRLLLEKLAASSATTIIGGGDTVALADDLGMLDKFSFVSTGGGAMLDFLSSETLPGIDALKKG